MSPEGKIGLWIIVFAAWTDIVLARLTSDEYGNYFIRHRRETRCAEKYATITDGHSACLPPSPSVQEKGLMAGEKETIVDHHNTVRREVSPTATNMAKMSWDDEIAVTAQRWAENCYTNHDKNYKRYAFGKFSVGQNLAWGSIRMGWTKAISLWADEKKYFHYGSSPTGEDGHYTQMVWAGSAKVGCGYANCAGTHYYVCNYGPAGNSGDATRPYQSGTTCADCPSACDNGLCYCNNIDVCLNGGTLDYNSCSCSCTKDFYLQPKCALNCTGIKEPSYCGPQFTKSMCTVYSNVPQECPDLCGWCPSAGYNSGDGNTSGTQAVTTPTHLPRTTNSDGDTSGTHPDTTPTNLPGTTDGGKSGTKAVATPSQLFLLVWATLLLVLPTGL